MIQRHTSHKLTQFRFCTSPLPTVGVCWCSHGQNLPAGIYKPNNIIEPTCHIVRRGGSAAYWGAMDEGLDDLDLGIGDVSLARSPPAKKVSFDGGYAENQNQTNPGQGLDVDRSALLRKGSSDYWTSGNWNLDQRGMMKVDKRPDPAMVEETDTPSTQSGSASVKCLPRKDSNAYWDADQWDPDERIYVGAEAGQTNHLTAVIQSDDKLIRAWPGGLTCGGTCGQSGPVDILKALKALGEVSEVPEHPELRDIYEVEAESVGFGSFGIVRKATHLPSGTHCVVKSLKKSQSGPLYKSQVEHGLFEQLLSMSVRTPHDGIVKYLDMLESEDSEGHGCWICLCDRVVILMSS